MMRCLVGIAIVVALLAENTQTVHSRLVEHLRPDNPLARMPHMAPPFSLTDPSGLAALNAGSLNYLKTRSEGRWAWPPTSRPPTCS